eukprot:gene39132-48332_t
MEIYQTDILVNKDKRMGIINEVLNSIRVIKLYAWEEKFMQKITVARTMELSSLSSYCICQSLMMVVYETVPAIVGVAAFVTHTHLLGLPLSPSTGFTALALFNLLREPLTDFPGMLNWLVKANVALGRIQSFLNSDDVKGMPTGNNNNYNDRRSNSGDSEKSISPTPSTKASSNIDGLVEMRNVTLAWPPNNDSPFTIDEDESEEGIGFDSEIDDASSLYGMIVLDDISFKVPPQSLAVVVGMTGS